MKNRTLKIVRSFFISPEILGALFLVVAFRYFPNIFNMIGKKYLSKSDWAIFVMPNVALLGFGLSQIKGILFPINDSMKHLAKWPDYQWLKDVSLLGIIFCFGSAISAFFLYFLKDGQDPGLVGLIFMINLTVSVISTASLCLAQINIKIHIQTMLKE